MVSLREKHAVGVSAIVRVHVFVHQCVSSSELRCGVKAQRECCLRSALTAVAAGRRRSFCPIAPAPVPAAAICSECSRCRRRCWPSVLAAAGGADWCRSAAAGCCPGCPLPLRMAHEPEAPVRSASATAGRERQRASRSRARVVSTRSPPRNSQQSLTWETATDAVALSHSCVRDGAATLKAAVGAHSSLCATGPQCRRLRLLLLQRPLEVATVRRQAALQAASPLVLQLPLPAGRQTRQSCASMRAQVSARASLPVWTAETSSPRR